MQRYGEFLECANLLREIMVKCVKFLIFFMLIMVIIILGALLTVGNVLFARGQKRHTVSALGVINGVLFYLTTILI